MTSVSAPDELLRAQRQKAKRTALILAVVALIFYLCFFLTRL